MRQLKIDSFIHLLFRKYRFYICFLMILLFSLLIRFYLTPIVHYNNDVSDYQDCLLPWVNIYKQLGFIALSQGFTDYYIPYNVFLAFISYLPGEPAIWISAGSCFFDYLSAFTVYYILKKILGNKRKHYMALASVSTTILPLVFINSSLWKQCDSIYTCLMLISLYFLLAHKSISAFIFFGLAFSFKQQSLLFLPFYIMVYLLYQKLSIVDFLFVPLMYLLTGLPAIILGRPAAEVYKIYFNQTQCKKEMAVNSPTIYNFGMTDFEIFKYVPYIILLFIFMFTVCHLENNKKRITVGNLYCVLGWSVMTCYEFLPCMHERYDYAAVLILTTCAIFRRELIIPVIMMNLVSACTYGWCLNGFNAIPLWVLSLFYLIAWIWISKDVLFDQLSTAVGISSNRVNR